MGYIDQDFSACRGRQLARFRGILVRRYVNLNDCESSGLVFHFNGRKFGHSLLGAKSTSYMRTNTPPIYRYKDDKRTTNHCIYNIFVRSLRVIQPLDSGKAVRLHNMCKASKLRSIDNEFFWGRISSSKVHDPVCKRLLTIARNRKKHDKSQSH